MERFDELGYGQISVKDLASFADLWNAVLLEDYVEDINGSSKPIRYPVWELGTDPHSGKSIRTFDDRWTKDCEYVPCPHWLINGSEWQTVGAIPGIYQTFVKDLVEKIGGDYTRIDCMLHNTLVDYMNPWHNHYLDGSVFNILVHMGVDNRSDQDGGRLELGRLDRREEYGDYIDYINRVKSETWSHALPLYAEGFTVTKVGEVPCHHGDTTIIKNTCARYVHQVSRVKSESPRYTLLLSMRR